MNYFNLFQLPQTLKINKKKLTNMFYTLQKKYHPDSINISKISKKKQLSMTIKINQGFNILKKKLTRAKHLLEINKKEVGFKKKIIDNEKKWLIKQFELYEIIQNIQNDTNVLIKINKFIQNIKKKISLYFCKFEEKIKKKNIDSANKVFIQLLFIYKIFNKAKKIKKKQLK